MAKQRALHNSLSGAPKRSRVSPRKQPQQDRSLVTVDAILKGGAQVLVRLGYDRATTSLIADAAGVSVGSLYQYFPNKDAVFSMLLERTLEQLVAQMAGAVALVASEGIASKVRAAVTALVTDKAKNPRLHRALKTELGRLDGARILKRMNDQALGMVELVLVAHHAELALSDPKRAAFLVVNAIEGIIGATLIEAPATLSEPRLVDELCGMAMAVLNDARCRE